MNYVEGALGRDGGAKGAREGRSERASKRGREGSSRPVVGFCLTVSPTFLAPHHPLLPHPPPCLTLPPLRHALPPTPAILMSGVVWIVTSPTVDLVIRSTVAVMFVLNVDEIIYQSCCPASIMDDVEVCVRVSVCECRGGTPPSYVSLLCVYLYLFTSPHGLREVGMRAVERREQW